MFLKMKKVAIHIILVAHLTLSLGCDESSYEVAPYSQKISDTLIRSRMDINDPPPPDAQELILRAEKVYFFHKPDQPTAFPIITDYSEKEPSLLLSEEDDVNQVILNLRKGGFGSRAFGDGTLHVVIEFEGMRKKAAYYIFYLSTGSGTPIFAQDFVGFDCLEFLNWVEKTYPDLMVEEEPANLSK